MSPSDAEEEEEAAAVVSSCCSPVLSMLTLVSQPPPPRSATREVRPGFLGPPRPVKNGRPPTPGHADVRPSLVVARGAVNDNIHDSLVVGGSCCGSGRRGAGGSHKHSEVDHRDYLVYRHTSFFLCGQVGRGFGFDREGIVFTYLVLVGFECGGRDSSASRERLRAWRERLSASRKRL